MQKCLEINNISAIGLRACDPIRRQNRTLHGPYAIRRLVPNQPALSLERAFFCLSRPDVFSML
jgi:hypothetical protein